jgi:ubiquinone/menaquinone biosynthesis C-methylase UbiE
MEECERMHGIAYMKGHPVSITEPNSSIEPPLPTLQISEVISQWSKAAPYWEKHREVIRGMFAPVTQALIEEAEICASQTVLDVATGPGEPALSIAGLIGTKGRVTGTDVVPEMVEAARREADRRGLHNAGFETAFADKLPFPTNTFDAIVCRFGIMFFPSPEEAVRECLRVLKPGGRIAFAVWHFAHKNPFHHVIQTVVDRYVAPLLQAPDSPDAFRFADPGKLRAVFSRAGVDATTERLLLFSIQASISAESFWRLRSEMSEKLHARIASLSNQQVAELNREVIEALGAYSCDHGMAFPAEVLIVSGRKESA